MNARRYGLGALLAAALAALAVGLAAAQQGGDAGGDVLRVRLDGARAVYVQDAEGAFATYVIGAPDFVNAPFAARWIAPDAAPSGAAGAPTPTPTATPTPTPTPTATPTPTPTPTATPEPTPTPSPTGAWLRRETENVRGAVVSYLLDSTSDAYAALNLIAACDRPMMLDTGFVTDGIPMRSDGGAEGDAPVEWRFSWQESHTSETWAGGRNDAGRWFGPTASSAFLGLLADADSGRLFLIVYVPGVGAYRYDWDIEGAAAAAAELRQFCAHQP